MKESKKLTNQSKSFPLYYLGMILIILSTFQTVEAKNHKFKQSNYSIKLDRSWKNENNSSLSDQSFSSQKKQQSLLIRRLAHIKFENDQFPSNKEEFIQYLKTHTSFTRVEKFKKMADNYFSIQPFKEKSWSGFITNLKFIDDEDELNIGYVVITMQKHAYLLTILNYNNSLITEKQVSDIVSGFKVLDKSKTLENTKVTFKPLKTGFKSDYFGLEVPHIKGMDQVSNSDIGLSEEDSIFNFILYNKNLKFEFTISSYCDVSEFLNEKELLKYYIHGHKDSLEEFNIKYDNNQIYASGKILLDGTRLQHYFYKALMFNECQHVVMYHDKINRSIQPLLDFVKLLKDIPKNHSNIDGESLSKQNIKHALRLNALANNAASYDLSNALKLYQKAIKLNNKDPDYLKNYLFVANQLAKYKLALNTLNKADESLLNKLEFKSWKAWLLSQTENTSEAIETYKDLFNQEYTNDIDMFRYLDLLSMKESWQEMLGVIDTHKDKVSKQKSLKLKLITAYHKTGNIKKAQSLLNDITDKENLSDYNIFEVLDVCYLTENHQKGLDLVQTQIDNEVKNANTYFYRGVFQFELKQNDNALESMQKALEFQPNNKEIQDYINGINLSQGIGDIAIVKTPIKPVELPDLVSDDIQNLKLSDNSEPVENYYYVTGYDYEKNKKSIKTVYRKYRINDLQSTEESKTVRLKFNESYEHPFINKFSVRNLTTNKITELDINTVYITSANDGIEADGDKFVNIPVPSIENNVEIEYILSTQSNNPVENFVLETEYFVSVREYQYMASFLTGDIQDVSSFSSKNVEVLETDKLLIWKSNHIEKYKQEPLMPDIHDQFDWLKLSSIEKDWKTLGNIYLEKVQEKLNSDISKGLLLSIIPDSRDPSVIAKELAQYVQSSITYQALEFGSRAQIPNKSSKTLTNKYGDCKDHAVLLHDLLKKKGIESQLALVSTSKYINRDIYTLDQFDHMVLYLPEINGGVFIDPTDKYTAIDLITPPRAVHGSLALVVEKDNSTIIEIPSIEPMANMVTIDRVVDQTNEHYIFTETAVLNGYRASDFRAYLQPLNKEHINTEIIQWVHSYYNDLTLKDFNYYNLAELEKPLVIEMVFKQDKSSSDFKVPAFIERASLSFSYVENRKYPFVIDEPFYIESSTSVENEGIVLNDREEKETSDSIEWSLMTNSSKSAQQFKVNIPTGKYPATDYKNFINSIKKALFKIEKSLSLK